MTVSIYQVHMITNGHAHEHIAEVKWKQASSGKSGEATVAKVVHWIDNQKLSVITDDGKGNRANVGTVHPSGHVAYIRTHRDRTPSDNLLHLPRY